MLQSGIAAPSAENRHWLRFEVAENSLTLVATDAAAWAAEPHREWLSRMSHGAVVENMTLRAAARGLRLATRWIADPARPDVVARCEWTPVPPATDPLNEAIERRRTNRRFYRRERVSRDALARIAAAAQAVPGVHLRWLDDASSRAMALGAIRLAETERFRRERLHRELFEAIRFEAGWRTGVEEGLAPASLEVEPPMRPVFAALRRWPLMRACTAIGLHHVLGLRAGDLPCRLAPHLGLVACDAETPAAGAIAAGRGLERAWLGATVEGVALQPMAAAAALLRQPAGGGWVSEDVQARIRDVLGSLTGGSPDSAWMFVRVGHARSPSAAAGRPPLERFLGPVRGEGAP
jgi:hypothetical protein